MSDMHSERTDGAKLQARRVTVHPLTVASMLETALIGWDRALHLEL